METEKNILEYKNDMLTLLLVSYETDKTSDGCSNGETRTLYKICYKDGYVLKSGIRRKKIAVSDLFDTLEDILLTIEGEY